jgi:hypothetical protein
MSKQRPEYLRNYLHSSYRNLRVTALALTAVLSIGGGADWASAQDAEGSSGSESQGDAGGTDSSGASQGTAAGATAGDGSATGDTTGTADASQTSGDSNSAAGADTGASATATQTADGYSAEGSASGQGSATLGGVGGPYTTSLEATATATYGSTQTASASTAEDGITTTSATATFGVSAEAYAPGGKEIEKVGEKKTIAVAVLPNKTYSIAITTKKYSLGKSGIYSGSYQTFSGRDLKAAIRAAVSAFAKATGYSAQAGAYAGASGSTRSGAGWASASSKSWAKACVGKCATTAAKKQQKKIAALLAQCSWVPREGKLYCKRR